MGSIDYDLKRLALIVYVNQILWRAENYLYEHMGNPKNRFDFWLKWYIPRGSVMNDEIVCLFAAITATPFPLSNRMKNVSFFCIFAFLALFLAFSFKS